ncbi:G-type lectin S-receptor-like serine/threonine-protein kinase LECRK3 [Benincasa hispida]|uniref:G-type lectin S-receptor-like serine/threonine-protein kinase LECRK3 n=1 Tax=Benincasa hispida TaxID=102211 RepID=UPI001901E9E2|nr:G-type lectin S-receptor-like serine/threonine-protein kinase LECRK3 [Benincasa hispida]
MACMIPHILLLLPLVVYAQSNSMLNVGSFLIAGDASASPWISPADHFAFGFREVDDGLFLLCIWYKKIDEKTIVWFAQHDQNPVPKGSKMEVTASDGLLLQSSQGGEPWKSSPISGVVAFGTIYDTGNLVLLDSNSNPLWESFKQPVDTLLPTQKMEVNDFLSSRKSRNTHSLGKFQLRLFEGNLVLNIRSLPTMYTYEPYYVIQSSEGNQIVFDEDGFLYIMQRNGRRVNISEPERGYPADTHYYQVTLNFDGVITVSHQTRNPSAFNATWMDFKKIPNNICVAMSGNLSSGVCGYNSICTLNNDQRPSCKCPPGYSLIDPNNKYGDCMPNIPQICEGAKNLTNDLYSLQDLPNTDWPMHDYELLGPFTFEECKNACLLDCFCVVVVYRDNSCWKKRLPLSNGREDSSEKAVSYLKLRNTSSIGQDFDLPISKGKNQNTLVIVLSILLGSSLLIVLVLVSLISRGFIFHHRKKHAGDFLPRGSFGTSMQKFTFKEVRDATNGFKEELGRGSCAIVYKGVIEVGPIAVKKFNEVSEDSEEEFKTEVNVVGQTHHKNIVRLFGCCDDNKNCILIYEFMSNGNLASFLFGDTKLSWDLRTKIIYGIARGLLYLHDECNIQIIHCDIKPQNVLLDEDYNPKISDFGLAKLLKMDQSRNRIETNIKGTTGYIAPDWFKSTPVTTKVDVYSFGVLLLEIICCRRNGDMEVSEEGREILVDWAYDCFQQGRLDVLVEGDLKAIDDMRRLERFVMVAIWCIQEDPSQRPTMKRVIPMLEGIVPVSIPPNPCPFTSSC